MGPFVPARGNAPIVVGVDGSDDSRWALKWAADEAEVRGQPLRILHARTAAPRKTPGWYESMGNGMSGATAVVDDAEALAALRHPSVILLGAEVVDGPPTKALTLASLTSSLLVVGARGRGGFHELLLGSVSDQCAQHAHCPVAIVHVDPDLPTLLAERPIVVGIDGSLGSTRALRWALEEATLRHEPVVGVYAWQYPPIGSFVSGPRRGVKAAAQEVLDAAQEYADKWASDVPFEADARPGDSVQVIIEAARGAGLLVVGARGHGGFKGAQLGSVAHQLARHADCAVVVARVDPGPGASSSGERSHREQREEDQDVTAIGQSTPRAARRFEGSERHLVRRGEG